MTWTQKKSERAYALVDKHEDALTETDCALIDALAKIDRLREAGSELAAEMIRERIKLAWAVKAARKYRVERDEALAEIPRAYEWAECIRSPREALRQKLEEAAQVATERGDFTGATNAIAQLERMTRHDAAKIQSPSEWRDKYQDEVYRRLGLEMERDHLREEVGRLSDLLEAKRQ